MNHELTWPDVYIQAAGIAFDLRQAFAPNRELFVYPVPRGGIHAAQAVITQALSLDKILFIHLTENPESANVIIDDLIDSGATQQRYNEKFPEKPFYVLINKQEEKIEDWVVFPWERATDEGDGPQENIRRILEYIGEDPTREGLLKTPERVIKSYNELFSGYELDPADIMTTFEETCDEMVILKDIEFCSMCEHHMLPFIGRAHIGYIPNGEIIGISKLARLVEIYARRLQVQERLTEEITTAMDNYLRPKGSACVIEAQHQCMTCRGVGKQHSKMITSSLTGAFRELPEVRAEFMSMIKG